MTFEDFSFIFFSSLIQGVTEFLPVSSSGHLVIFNSLFPNNQGNLDFGILLHFGTIFSIIFFYKSDIFQMLFINQNSKKYQYILFLIIGCIPISIVGYFLKNFIELELNQLQILPYTYLVSCVAIYLTKFKYQEKSLSLKIILILSIVHIIALMPGISRSGITISTLIILGINVREATRLSFLMAIPLIFGATIISIDNQTFNNITYLNAFIGVILSFGFGLIAIYLTNYFLNNKKYWMFSIYCFIMSLISSLII
tara:strand:+ start:3616 stop:4380 length:765 start_codon:yes stop_codon:yes gene_type:complete